MKNELDSIFRPEANKKVTQTIFDLLENLLKLEDREFFMLIGNRKCDLDLSELKDFMTPSQRKVYKGFRNDQAVEFLKDLYKKTATEPLLEINEVQYGATWSNRINATLLFKGFIVGGAWIYPIKITNMLIGMDPLPGIKKTLFVQYTYCGVPKQIEVLEGDFLKLPTKEDVEDL